jgi:hypothetical protein
LHLSAEYDGRTVPDCDSRYTCLFRGHAFFGDMPFSSTCRRHEIDPQLYFTQLLFNLPTTQPSELSAWLPDQWNLNQSASTTPA